MRVLLFWTFLINSVCFANAKTWNFDFKKDIALKSTQDVYTLSTQSGNSYVLCGDCEGQIPFTNAMKWPQGKKLILGFRDDRGVYIEDNATKRYVMVYYSSLGKDYIDEKFEECMSKAISKPDLSDCHHNTEQMWDIQLNQNYKILAKKFTAKDPKASDALKKMQKSWIVYRDQLFEVIPYQLFVGVNRYDEIKKQARLLGGLIN